MQEKVIKIAYIYSLLIEESLINTSFLIILPLLQMLKSVFCLSRNNIYSVFYLQNYNIMSLNCNFLQKIFGYYVNNI